MVENFLRPAVEDNNAVWFQQDGATAHTAGETIDLLREIFGERLVSKNSEFSWPPRSPDLSAPDYFLWGYLKQKVYVDNPQTIRQLKENIRTKIRLLQPETLHAVMENVLKRAILCEQENGGHLKNIIFHT